MALSPCCRFQDRQVVGANLRLASESPLLVQARRIALGDRTPVVLANLGSDRYHPGSLALASERPVLVVRWGLLSMVVRSLSLSVSNTFSYPDSFFVAFKSRSCT
jgi:hypothetical protein